MLAGGVSGCNGKISSIVSESMGTEGFSDAQMMLIVASERNRCQKIYTDQIWDTVVDDAGTTFQTYLLEEIQKFLRELKVMNLLADERQIALSAREKEELNALADSYYESMSDADRAYTGATRDDVYTMYEAYHRANRLVDALTQNVNLEVSDSEARVITVSEASFSEGFGHALCQGLCGCHPSPRGGWRGFCDSSQGEQFRGNCREIGRTWRTLEGV